MPTTMPALAEVEEMELSDDELEGVAGGAGNQPAPADAEDIASQLTSSDAVVGGV